MCRKFVGGVLCVSQRWGRSSRAGSILAVAGIGLVGPPRAEAYRRVHVARTRSTDEGPRLRRAKTWPDSTPGPMTFRRRASARYCRIVQSISGGVHRSVRLGRVPGDGLHLTRWRGEDHDGRDRSCRMTSLPTRPMVAVATTILPSYGPYRGPLASWSLLRSLVRTGRKAGL